MPLPALGRRRSAGAPTPAYNPIAAAQTVSSHGACNERLDSDLYVYNDGTLDYRRENFGSSAQFEYDQYCTVTPTVGFGDDYHIKLTPQAGSNFYDGSSGDSLSTWHALTSDRVWHFDWQDCSSNSDNVFDLEISDDGGSTTLDTTVITINMEHDTP